MTLEEAIQKMKEAFENAPNEYERSVQDGLQLLGWLESYKTISESYPEVCKKIDRLEEENMSLLRSALRLGKRCEVLESENSELNRLTMLAMDSMQVMSRADGCVACSQCRYETPIGEDENGNFINSPHCDKSDCFECRHHDEAMELLGGTENAEN